MDSALAHHITPSSPVVFQDALGERRRLETTAADTVELLCLRGELTAIPSFEFALRERASRLSTFRHTYYGRVRGVDRLSDPSATLAVVSDHTRGVRLSTLLSETGPRPITIDINVALHFIRQLVSAVAMLHESARDVAHGAIGPERIIVTPNARVVIVEYVLGAALEQLRFSHERYWRELRVALPPGPGLPRFDHRADVTQVGVVALSLVLGRMLHEDEYAERIGDVVGSAWAISAKGGLEPLPPGLRSWLSRSLQLDARHSFASALEARTELDKVLAGEHEEQPAAVSLPRVADRSAAPPAEAVADKTVRDEPRRDEPRNAEPREGVRRDEPRREERRSQEPRRDEPRPEEPRLEEIRREDVRRNDVHDPIVETPADPSDPTDEPETEPEPFMSRVAPTVRRAGRIAAIAVAAAAVAGGGVFGARRYFVTPVSAVASGTGTVSINTNPTGAVVLVDGDSRGVTPLTLTLKAGPHRVELRGTGDPRTLPLTVTAGTQVSQYIELPATPTVSVGQIEIRTEPAGAQVMVDGTARGRSPLLVEGVAPGEHLVTLQSEFGTVKQTVTVAAATTAALVVPMGSSEGAPLSGWVSVSAPVDVQIFENKRLLGTSQSDRIMVSAGKHEIELVNETLGYRSVKVVQVPAGKVTAIKIEWPKGTIAVNAVPWAEVWIDGERIGDTPIGNLSLPIGPHEIVFRHPEFGELRHAATVTVNAPTRVSVDLRKK